MRPFNRRLPKELRKATVVPLFKGIGTYQEASYRPPREPHEAVGFHPVTQTLQVHQLPSPQQHGFWKVRFCLSNLSDCGRWSQAIADCLLTDVIYANLRKAFDRVSHHKLMEKLNYFGIPLRPCRWINDFMQGRSLIVRVSNLYSNCMR